MERKMNIKERLEMHKQIEQANARHLDLYRRGIRRKWRAKNRLWGVFGKGGFAL